MKRAFLSILLAGTLAVSPAASVLASTATASQTKETNVSDMLNYIGSLLEETEENEDKEAAEEALDALVSSIEDTNDQGTDDQGTDDQETDDQETGDQESDGSDDFLKLLSILFGAADEEDAEAAEEDLFQEDEHVHEDVYEDEHVHEDEDVYEDEHAHEDGHHHEEDHIHEEEDWEFEDWNEDAPSLAKLQEFVESVCDESSDTYVPEQDRIAVFDMDGTVYGELAPIYLEWLLFAHRALDDPNYEADDEMKEVARRVIQAEKERHIPEDLNILEAKDQIRSFEGMTIDEFNDYVNEFLKTDVWGFSGMTYGDAFYAPIIEVIDYLDANDFTVYLVSGSDRYLCRALIDGILAIEPEHVIGMDPLLEASSQGDTPGYDFNISAGDEILRTGELVVKNLKVNKVTGIIREIGHQPILSFGNSGGDVSMGLYTITDNKYPSEAFMLVADDDERDWADASKAPALIEKWEGYGFNVISMKNDFRTIYGDDVVRDEVMPEIIVPEDDNETEAESTEEAESVAEEAEPVAEEAETTEEEKSVEEVINAILEGIAEEIAVSAGIDEAAAEEIAEEVVTAAGTGKAAVEEIAEEVTASVGTQEAAIEEILKEIVAAIEEATAEEAVAEEAEAAAIAEEAAEAVAEEAEAAETESAIEEIVKAVAAAIEEATAAEAAAEETAAEDVAAAEETVAAEAAAEEPAAEDVAAAAEAAAAEEAKEDEAASEETDGKSAEAETDEKQETTEDTVYVVKAGENLWGIAAKTLGSGSEFRKIAEANGLDAPFEIRPGQEIIIPAA